jgi:hypothetical protein
MRYVTKQKVFFLGSIIVSTLCILHQFLVGQSPPNDPHLNFFFVYTSQFVGPQPPQAPKNAYVFNNSQYSEVTPDTFTKFSTTPHVTDISSSIVGNNSLGDCKHPPIQITQLSLPSSIGIVGIGDGTNIALDVDIKLGMLLGSGLGYDDGDDESNAVGTTLGIALGRVEGSNDGELLG